VPEVLVRSTDAAIVRPRIEAETLIGFDRLPAWLER
jgi:diaminopimelate decarboxylase